MIFWKAPCKDRRGDERLSELDAKTAAHVETCAACTQRLATLDAQRVALRALGDVPGAAPTDSGFHRVMSALAEERERTSRAWLVPATAAVLLAIVGGFGVRQLVVARARRTTDDAIVAGADAAFRRAEHEYDTAMTMLRERIAVEQGGRIDPQVEAGARALEEARDKATALVTAHRGDPEREALLRSALRAEVRYYEDALMRIESEPRP